MVAAGTLESGFAKWLADQISQMPEFSLAALVIFVICFLTEVISNMACVQIFGPILITIAGEMCYSPLKFLFNRMLCFVICIYDANGWWAKYDGVRDRGRL